jgi:hypothetical protein
VEDAYIRVVGKVGFRDCFVFLFCLCLLCFLPIVAGSCAT